MNSPASHPDVKHNAAGITSRRKRFACDVVSKAAVLDERTESRLVKSFCAVPRESFLERRFGVRAYDDIALPIGFDQFSFRPSHVARILSLADASKGQQVLEIGTGSGYCAALLAESGARVFSMETIGLLAQQTRRRLDSLGFANVIIKTMNGKYGWSDQAPFDTIISWVAFPCLPATWEAQIRKDGGRIVTPLGVGENQRLTLFESRGGELARMQLERSCFPEATP